MHSARICGAFRTEESRLLLDVQRARRRRERDRRARGVVTGLVDATCGLSVFMKLPDPTRIATLDLRIDYLKPATPGLHLHARADCYKLTKQVAFVRACAYHDDPDDAIASAAGTVMIFD